MTSTKLNKHSKIILNAASSLGLSTKIIFPPKLVQVSSDQKKALFFQTQIQHNSPIALKICKYKNLTHQLLSQNDLPVPSQWYIETLNQFTAISRKLTYPLVIKPSQGTLGNGVAVNILDETTAKKVIADRLATSSVVIEPFLEGTDHRLLVLDGKVIAIVRKLPPSVTGNGHNTIRQLAQSNPRLVLDEEVDRVLNQQGVTLDTVPANGQEIYLRYNANGSTGGLTTTLENDAIHPDLLQLAVDACRTIGVTWAGVDMIIQDPQKPRQQNAWVIEINGRPGIYLHYHPTVGKPQPVATTLLKWLFNH